jgi:hypothetical protein
MRKLVFLVSCLLVLGFSGSAMAYVDGPGDAFVSDVDIQEVTLEVYDQTSTVTGFSNQLIKLGIKMASGSLNLGF